MDNPNIAAKQPMVTELEPGTYWYCSCGNSANQPFCDGAHQDTGFSPIKFEIAETQRVALCQCKHTDNAPYCDGSHAKL